MAAAGDVGAEPGRPPSATAIAAFSAAVGVRVLGADVDEALGGADGDAGDRHALDQHEGVALHQHPVGEGAAVALVGVADDVLLVAAAVSSDGLPLDAGRESRRRRGRAGPRRSPRRRSASRPVSDSARASPAEAACAPVVVERQRVDDAAAGEGQPGLAGEERRSLDRPDRLRDGPPPWRPAADRAPASAPRAGPSSGRSHSADPPISTSTSGSSQSMPRMPLRTSVDRRAHAPRARCASAAATASAPTATAAASRGTKTGGHAPASLKHAAADAGSAFSRQPGHGRRACPTATVAQRPRQ